MNNMYDILAKLNSVGKQNLTEGWKGELAGGTAGGIAGTIAGNAISPGIGGMVGGALGATAGGMAGGPAGIASAAVPIIGKPIARHLMTTVPKQQNMLGNMSSDKAQAMARLMASIQANQ